MSTKDFLNPASMLTPGVAGGTTATLVLPLVTYFNISFHWASIIVSFVIALTLIISSDVNIMYFKKAMYCILNTLVIFSVSVGAGVNIDNKPVHPEFKSIPTSSLGFQGVSLPNENFIHRVGYRGLNLIKLCKLKLNIGSLPDYCISVMDKLEMTTEQRIDVQKYLSEVKKYNELNEKYKKRWLW